MRKFLVGVFLTLASIGVNAQVYSIGHRQLSFTDPSRANRSIPAEVYYPAESNGDDVAIASGQFPVLVFGHGFVMTVDAYDVVRNLTVPEGFIMVFPTTEGSFSPSHTDFGKDLAFLVGAMKAEGQNSSSAFFGSISEKSAVMGHSMGGGSAFLAVQYDSSITALVTLAAAVTNPSSVTAAADITIPSLTISGANDCIAPAVDHQLPMYTALASECKSYVSILGASHCQFAGTSVTCSFGELTCSPGPAIAPLQQQVTAALYLNSWLKFYLKDDCAAAEEFQTSISTAISIDGQQNCALICASTGEGIFDTPSSLKLLPNPSNGRVTVSAETNWEKAHISVMNMLGEVLLIQEIHQQNSAELNLDFLKNGMYLIAFTEHGKSTRIQKLLLIK
jgi:predicted dienelactone hydrolase